MIDFEEKLKKTLDATKIKLGTIRTGRANPELLSRIQVDYYGTLTPLQQVASISVAEGTTLVINVFDKNAVENIEKAIQKSDLGLTPQTDGSVIRLRLPSLTEDRRKDLIKVAKQQAEEGKVALRHIRREYLDQLKSGETLSEDEHKKQQDSVQKLIDTYVDAIDKITKEKESEILTI